MGLLWNKTVVAIMSENYEKTEVKDEGLFFNSSRILQFVGGGLSCYL